MYPGNVATPNVRYTFESRLSECRLPDGSKSLGRVWDSTEEQKKINLLQGVRMRPKMAKMRLKIAKMKPKMVKMRAKMFKMRPKMVKMRPKMPKMRAKMTKKRPEMAKMRPKIAKP